MPDWLLSIPAFILAIGILVSVHEYGHFWVARKLGVKVLRFSVGFGPKLFGKTHNETEYVLAAIPLGGYVKMLDEREGDVPEAQRHRAFNNQAPWKRILIVAAGPGVNFLFAIFAYWCVLTMGVEDLKPELAAPAQDTVAYSAGLREGDLVLQVAGREIPTWNELRLEVLKQGLFADELDILVETQWGEQKSVTLPLEGVGTDPRGMFGQLGIRPVRPAIPALLGEVLPDTAAERAGLQKGDLITAFEGQPINDWSQLVALIQAKPEQQVSLQYLRADQLIELELVLGSFIDNEQLKGRLGAGVDVDPSLWQDLQVEYAPGPIKAVPEAIKRTWDMSVLTIGMLGHMLFGDVSWKNVSGPVQIASYAGHSASIGLDVYIAFLALVSVSLGVLNLLPIPVLDGGHLLYYSIEMIRGKPLSERVQIAGQKLGFVMLAALMTVALYNDFLHIFSGL